MTMRRWPSTSPKFLASISRRIVSTPSGSSSLYSSPPCCYATHAVACYYILSLASQLVLCFLLRRATAYQSFSLPFFAGVPPAHPFPINDISHRTSRPPARSSLILFAPTTMLSGLYYNPLSHHVPSTEGVVEPGR